MKEHENFEHTSRTQGIVLLLHPPLLLSLPFPLSFILLFPLHPLFLSNPVSLSIILLFPLRPHLLSHPVPLSILSFSFLYSFLYLLLYSSFPFLSFLFLCLFSIFLLFTIFIYIPSSSSASSFPFLLLFPLFSEAKTKTHTLTSPRSTYIMGQVSKVKQRSRVSLFFQGSGGDFDTDLVQHVLGP